MLSTYSCHQPPLATNFPNLPPLAYPYPTRDLYLTLYLSYLVLYSTSYGYGISAYDIIIIIIIIVIIVNVVVIVEPHPCDATTIAIV